MPVKKKLFHEKARVPTKDGLSVYVTLKKARKDEKYWGQAAKKSKEAEEAAAIANVKK